jgi:hypothetical protein
MSLQDSCCTLVGKLKNETKHGNSVLEEEIGNGWPLHKLIIAEV